MENGPLQILTEPGAEEGGAGSSRETGPGPGTRRLLLLLLRLPGLPRTPGQALQMPSWKAAAHSSKVAGGARRPTATISRTFPVGSFMENIIRSESKSLNSLAVKRSQKWNIKQRPGFKCSRM